MNSTDPLSVSELEQAFAVFNRVSHELDTTYRELESKVEALTAELASARSARLVELAEKERLAHRLSSLVAALPGGVLIVDAYGTVRDANPQACSLFGEPLVGAAWRAVLERVSAQGQPESQEQELLQLHGRRYSLSATRLDDTGDRVILITDVSQVHQLQEQLGRKKRLVALGEMAARLAHQVRTPLSSTTLYMAQLGRDDLAPQQRREVVAKVNDRLHHMGNLLESMLGFVRGATPVTQTVVLQDVLKTFGDAVGPQFRECGAALHLPVLDRTLSVEGDPEALVGALGNLAMNALEATGAGLALRVEVCALNEKWLQIEVSDNGPGIDEDALDRIFDPFFTTRAAGTGLGLAVVANTVSNHGGEISVTNHPGGGARFSIELPIAVQVNTESESRRSANG